MCRWILVPLIAAVLAGCAETAPSSQFGSGPALGSDTDGPFRLELVLPKAAWRTDEPITGTVSLVFDGPRPVNVYGSGSVINFAYAEVGGTRKVDPVWTADCGTHPLDPTAPLQVALGKSGAMADNDPHIDFLRSFLMAPDIRLPEGTWDITAIALFQEGQDCSGGSHSLEATVRVTVGD